MGESTGASAGSGSTSGKRRRAMATTTAAQAALPGITIGEVDAVAFAHRAGADMARGALDALGRLPKGAKRLAAQAYVDANLVRKQRGFLRRRGYQGRVVNVGHHDAHAASAFFPSP